MKRKVEVVTVHVFAFVVLALGATVALVLVPAFALQAALHAWFRGAEQVPLDEAWAERFETELEQRGARVQ